MNNIHRMDLNPSMKSVYTHFKSKYNTLYMEFPSPNKTTNKWIMNTTSSAEQWWPSKLGKSPV